MATRKERRERRQASKIAASMEKRFLSGALREELAELRLNEFDDGLPAQKQLEQLEDRHCLGVMAGIALGLPGTEVNQIMREYEVPVARNILSRTPHYPLPNPLFNTDPDPTKFDPVTGKRIAR